MLRRLRTIRHTGLALAACGLAGCAGGGGLAGQTEGLTTSSTTRAASVPLASELAALDCRRINGRMQVRILQIRDRLGETQSPVYAALKSTMNVFQASNAAPSTFDRATAHDVTVLQAQNDALKAKGCPQFDLAKELQPHPIRHTPIPTIGQTSKPG